MSAATLERRRRARADAALVRVWAARLCLDARGHTAGGARCRQSSERDALRGVVMCVPIFACGVCEAGLRGVVVCAYLCVCVCEAVRCGCVCACLYVRYS